jgi:tRNA-dihydrouridine synthase
MPETIQSLQARLKGGFFTSAIHEYTSGAYCAARSAGCAMVQTGLYFAEPGAHHQDRARYKSSFLPDDPGECLEFLREDVRAACSAAPVVVCMNLGSLELEPGLQAAGLFVEAGGDLVELNIHGGFTRYIQAGRMRAMILPENQAELYRWVEAYLGAGLPLIVKFNAREHRRDLMAVLERMAGYGLVGVHLNVRSELHKGPDLGLIERAKERYPGFLLVSGYVRSAAQARQCFEAGADMVGFAEPIMHDPDFTARLVQTYRAGAG